MAKAFQEWVAEIQAANPNDWLGGEWLDGAGGAWEAAWMAALDAAMAQCEAATFRVGNVDAALMAENIHERIAKLKDAPAAG